MKNTYEIILIGGHLDSWDSAQGAHDDGAGTVHSRDVWNILKQVGYKILIFMIDGERCVFPSHRQS